MDESRSIAESCATLTLRSSQPDSADYAQLMDVEAAAVLPSLSEPVVTEGAEHNTTPRYVPIQSR